MIDPSQAIQRYASLYRVQFLKSLGHGKDGGVFKTTDDQAVKFLISDELYRRELRAYQILRQRDIQEINGFQIPILIRNDDGLRAIEMTIVQPPFLLDFASAYTVDEYTRMDFNEEVLAERESHWAEIFGERWAPVQSVCNNFTRETGLILLDLSLNNIKFE